jgi:hypothetical protein
MAETAKGKKVVYVHTYTRDNGTRVPAHERSTPTTSSGESRAQRPAQRPTTRRTLKQTPGLLLAQERRAVAARADETADCPHGGFRPT